MKNIYDYDIIITSLETNNQFNVSWENIASIDRKPFLQLAVDVLEYQQDEICLTSIK